MTRTARRRATITSVLVLAVSTIASGCALSPSTNGIAADGSAVPTPSLGHIHGLGVDEATSTIYVAAHGGVFSISSVAGDSPPSLASITTPIAGRAQDTMGFTLLGDTMYGSGHPDPLDTEGNPADLGLIISTDGAESWQSVSLLGEVDFHDLAAARGADGAVSLHGYSATTGTVMTSLDAGATWTSGVSIAARDLAVDTGGGSLYATTPEGLVASDDGGATFTVVSDAPALYLIESLSDGTGRLVGVDTTGSIWSNASGDWRKTGTVTGPAEALTYSTGGSLVVADDRGISASNDLGATWHPLLLR